jgi:large subunit ribosomal protein L25
MVTLKARPRTPGKGNALRREALIPAVVYGPTVESLPIAIDSKALQEVFATITRSSRIDLSLVDGKKRKKLGVFVKAIQYDPLTDEPIHVDFYHPDKGHPLKLHVPVKVAGECPGVKEGGVLNVLFRSVLVHGLPKDIPHLITLDVSELAIGESLHVRDIDFGKVVPLLPPERTLVTVVAPRRAEEVVGPVEEALVEEGALEGETREEAEPEESVTERMEGDSTKGE